MEHIAEQSNDSPIIEILPMHQRTEIKHGKEDWTGKSSTVLRRKLQNRLNQRASRRRKLERQLDTSAEFTETLHGDAETKHRRFNETVELQCPLEVLQLQRPTERTQSICVNPYKRRVVTSATNFTSLLHTPLPSDQKLLTLLHFNLVRALVQNVFLLGLNPDDMDSDIPSPFVSPHPHLKREALPATLQPTELQSIVPHHPEIDVLPFPDYRDNMIRAGCTCPADEFCLDMLYGVGLDSNSESLASSSGLNGRTGLIVWSDPWLKTSWEIEEGFARKYKHFFGGCKDLIEITNSWRASRGEPPLVLEVQRVSQ